MPSKTRCGIRNCTIIPFVYYSDGGQSITITLCRQHLNELELRGRRTRDLVEVEKRAKEGA